MPDEAKPEKSPNKMELRSIGPKFAENVRAELERLGKNFSWLSRESGISQCMVSYYLSGRVEPTLSKALRISYALHTPLSQLAGEDLFHAKTLVSMVRRSPAAEQELVQGCPTGLLLKEMERRMKR